MSFVDCLIIFLVIRFEILSYLFFAYLLSPEITMSHILRYTIVPSQTIPTRATISDTKYLSCLTKCNFFLQLLDRLQVVATRRKLLN